MYMYLEMQAHRHDIISGEYGVINKTRILDGYFFMIDDYLFISWMFMD